MTYLKRVEDVLGPDWDKQAEGQKLKEEGEAFKKKLNTKDLFEEWKLKVCLHTIVLCLQGKDSIHSSVYRCCMFKFTL